MTIIAARQFCLAITLTAGIILKEEKMPSLVDILMSSKPAAKDQDPEHGEFCRVTGRVERFVPQTRKSRDLKWPKGTFGTLTHGAPCVFQRAPSVSRRAPSVSQRAPCVSHLAPSVSQCAGPSCPSVFHACPSALHLCPNVLCPCPTVVRLCPNVLPLCPNVLCLCPNVLHPQAHVIHHLQKVFKEV